jgi:HKD family nuclease
MDELQLLTSSDDSYLRAVTAAIEAATHVTLVTAFASPLGVELLTPALDKLLAKPNATAHLVLGMDRQGFNTVAVFEALLVLQAKWRVELGVVAQQAGLLHAKALLTEGPGRSELLLGSANLTSSGMRRNHELTLHVREVPAAVRAERGLTQAVRRRSIGDAARESRTLGYSIDLLSTSVAAQVRKTARRIAAQPTRLGLQLPCFGLWMPDYA